MKGIYLAGLIEDHCKENNLDISEFYKTLSEEYQAEWGINIVIQMESNGKWNITDYLDELGIAERYVSILNRIKKELSLNC